jgi:HK97 family phage major capsid protein
MGSIPQRIADLQEARELDGARRDFARLCRYFLLSRTGSGVAARMAVDDRAPERVVDAINSVNKAAVDPMSIASVGGVLSPFQMLAGAFLNSLASFSAFDAMLASMMKLPLRSRIVAVTSTITGASLAETDIKRVGSLQLSASDLTINKSAAVLAVTKEILVAAGDGVLTFLERELRQAVALVTDQTFLSLITAGATSIPSSGANAIAARLDIRALLSAINGPGASSRLFLITTPLIAGAWATLADSAGGPAFPNARYNGGDAGGIPIVPSAGCPSSTIILADASGIAGNSEGLRVDSSEVSSIQMDSSPDSPPIAATSYVNLWQQQMLGLKVERFFGGKVVRPNSVAIITGANYSGSSP